MNLENTSKSQPFDSCTSQLVGVGNKPAVRHFLQLLRISHWSKSFFVLLGVFYSHTGKFLLPALTASLAFCLISSAVYIYNDIQDQSEDSLHPHKRHRPLASETISLSYASFILFLLLITGLMLAWIVSKQVACIVCIYLLINLAYNHVLKLIPIVDVLCIATGFMLRVFAGTLGIGLHISLWLTVTATLLSLFIALNKRRLEMRMALKHSTRRVLKKYHPRLLHWAVVSTGFACFLTYLLYTVYARNQSFYFILTLPFSAFALWRFAWLSIRPVNNDDPIQVFLSDGLSRINLYCFVLLTAMALNA